MFAALLVHSVVSKRTISMVISGEWSGAITYSSLPLPDLCLNFTVARDFDRPTSMTTAFWGDPVAINLSTREISGNLTYLDGLYTFNFTELVAPFVSSHIELGPFGRARCTLASLVGVRCVFVNGTDTISIVFRKIAGQPGGDAHFLLRHWKSFAVMGAALFFRLWYSRWGPKPKKKEPEAAADEEPKRLEDGEAKKPDEGEKMTEDAPKKRKTAGKKKDREANPEPDAAGKAKIE
jgi:hypothetical protein